MFECDAVVVGAGVVGLAIARALALAGREVVIVEAAGAIGTGTSSRNSEAMHAGLYYPVGSLKARLCVAGRRALYSHCEERGIAHRRCGKLIVAADDAEAKALDRIAGQAAEIGVDDLVRLDKRAATALEPALACEAALLSPSTGIIDSHGLMASLLDDARSAGAVLALNTPVERGEVAAGGLVLHLGGCEPTRVRAATVINAAGLAAWQLTATLAGVPAATIPQRHFCKGNYFALATKSPFSRLIYPVPSSAGLGTHLTLDLDGRARFGPDVEWVPDAANLGVDEARAAVFYAAIRRYWPGLRDGALRPDYAGIRPKVAGPGMGSADFVIQDSATTKVDGYIALYGIESPGLTASLAIADHVATLV